MMNLTFEPVTPDRWDDFAKLFGKNGACGGCWCMSWRLKRKEFDANKGDANKQAMQAIIAAGEVPGLLAYIGSEPIGWCSVAPRSAFARLEASRMLKAVDDRPRLCQGTRRHRTRGVRQHFEPGPAGPVSVDRRSQRLPQSGLHRSRPHQRHQSHHAERDSHHKLLMTRVINIADSHVSPLY
jgi:hypothetical protein